MPLIFITENLQRTHKTAGAIQQAHIPFYYIKLITILQPLFLYKTVDYRKKVIDSYNYGYRYL